MRKTFFIIILAVSAIAISCNNDNNSNVQGEDPYAAAYPDMYKSLGLPEYRSGRVESVTGKDEGVKMVHNVIIISNDSPKVISAMITSKMAELGWTDQQARRRISKDISDDDLFLASYVSGTNKFEINAASTPSGETKTRITLSVFNQN